MKLTFKQVAQLIEEERAHQDIKYGSIDVREQTIPGFILVAQAELDEAKAGFIKNVPGKHSSLRELIQVAAVCVACIQTHGEEGNGE